MRHPARIALALFVAAATILGVPRAAAAQEREYDSVAAQASRGFHLDIGPTLLLPSRNEGPLGGGLNIEGRYGFQSGPTILAPGGRVAGYLVSQRAVGIVMPTVRLTVPVGPFAPYVVGGVGGGWLSNESESGLALLGGGGLMMHVEHIFAFGAEVSYQTITGTELKSLTIGPAFMFGG